MTSRDRPVSAGDPPAGLRERKKVQTRAAIRREAFRLIAARGFHHVTVEQIADAAEVSTSTFFRYFRTKEAVLLSDDHIAPIIDAFVAAPAELPPVAAYRHAVSVTFGALTDAQRADAIAGQRLMYSIPEARGLLYTEYVTLIGLIADALGRRVSGPADEAGRRVLAGAIVGVLIAASDGTPLPDEPLDRALQRLEDTVG